MWSSKILLFKALIFAFLIQMTSMQRLPELAADNEHLKRMVSGILKPRRVGTPGHADVRSFIIRELSELGFNTEIDEFNDKVPIFGNLNFYNIIGTINPNADKFLTLACHYDSKYFPNNPGFVAATDSAVPCAIIMNVAKTLTSYLRSPDFKNRRDIGLKVIFFDGEEAFKDWTGTDSLYGSRHLAKKLSETKTFIPSGSQTPISEIDRLELLVLLDLIGGKKSKFFSYFPNTNELHRNLTKIELYFRKAPELQGQNLMFIDHIARKDIDDDHFPFLAKNVPALHLISTPYPRQWHTPRDDAAHLHWPSIRYFNKVFRQFVHEYFIYYSGTK